MPVLVLPQRFSDDTVALWRAALSLGWDVERVGATKVPQQLARQEVVVYGETFFAQMVAEALSLALLAPSLDWLTRVPSQFVRRDIRSTTLDQARVEAGPAFFKPADDKCFPAAVYASGDDLPDEEWLPGSLPVLISEAVSWEVEFRCFVRDRTVLTMSPYVRGGELAQADDGHWPASDQEMRQAMDFAAETAPRPSRPSSAGLRAGHGVITDTGWAVVEANPAWASGIYGCDPGPVLSVLQRCTTGTGALTPEDRAWVRNGVGL